VAAVQMEVRWKPYVNAPTQQSDAISAVSTQLWSFTHAVHSDQEKDWTIAPTSIQVGNVCFGPRLTNSAMQVIHISVRCNPLEFIAAGLH
jgi:hypothetical protein